MSLQVYWGYSSHDSYPSKLATKKLCDVMLGVMPDDRFADRVLYSKPYYLTSYRLVVPNDAAQRAPWSASARSRWRSRMGVVRGLPEGTVTKSYPSLDSILEAVAKNEVKAGYVISTRSQWLAEQKWPGKLKFHDGANADRFPICAAFARRDARLVAARLIEAFAELAESGELAKVFARWHVPTFEATRDPVITTETHLSGQNSRAVLEVPLPGSDYTSMEASYQENSGTATFEGIRPRRLRQLDDTEPSAIPLKRRRKTMIHSRCPDDV